MPKSTAPRAIEPDGARGPAPRASDDDVEGHAKGPAPRAVEPEGARGPAPRAGDDDDVEGHVQRPR
jgi:hypothetical protein